MVRPKASKASCDLAHEFALAVTINTNNRFDMVARLGRYSLYAAFSHLAPMVRGSSCLAPCSLINDCAPGLSI